jgi:hypothetical protein
MRQLDVSNYVFGVDNLDEIKTKASKALAENDDVEFVRLAGELTKAAIYDVKGSVIEILFHQDLDLHANEVMEREDLARKIRNCPDGKILLEEVEWIHLRQAVETVPRLGRQEVEFIRRIQNAPKVEVEAKECKPLPAAPEPKTEE